MSTMTYYLRTRNETSTVAPSQVPNPPDIGPVVPLYSDVAGSRPPSPVKETSYSPVELGGRLSHEVDSEGAFGYSRTDMLNVNRNLNNTDKLNNDTSSEESEHPEQVNEQPWTTIRRRCVCSMDSTDRVRKDSGKKGITTKPLTKEQT